MTNSTRNVGARHRPALASPRTSHGIRQAATAAAGFPSFGPPRVAAKSDGTRSDDHLAEERPLD
jgi:hypothetical protein